MGIRLLNIDEENVWVQQWGRFKRQERSRLVFIWLAIVMHIIFWIIWHFFVAPYPIALTIPLTADLGRFNFLYDYFWLLGNTFLLVLTTVLIFKIYKKDIFASWLLLGANIFLHILSLSITLFLV